MPSGSRPSAGAPPPRRPASVSVPAGSTYSQEGGSRAPITASGEAGSSASFGDAPMATLAADAQAAGQAAIRAAALLAKRMASLEGGAEPRQAQRAQEAPSQSAAARSPVAIATPPTPTRTAPRLPGHDAIDDAQQEPRRQQPVAGGGGRSGGRRGHRGHLVPTRRRGRLCAPPASRGAPPPARPPTDCRPPRSPPT